MRRTRALWLSILVVLGLVGGSVLAYSAGTRPVLGLDLEGGVSVILSAPEGTPTDVMDQALENIRSRIDAFGTAEPVLYVTGNTIEVQIPGLAQGTIRERAETRYCLLDPDGANYGCVDDRAAAESRLDAATVAPVVSSACLTGDVWGDSPPCFGAEREARDAIAAISVGRENGAPCLLGTGLPESPCFSSREQAQTALDEIDVEVTSSFCVREPDGQTLSSEAGAACEATEEDATAILENLTVSEQTSQFCVVSSADKPLGCFLTRDAAEARLQQTGQERLLQVIGQTARLEEREVLQTLAPQDPAYAATPVTCGEPEQQETEACSFRALKDQGVVFLDRDGQAKYKLGPVEITGDAISRATASFDTGSQTSVGQGWQINFDLTDTGTATFADVTTRLVGRQLAIVVDRQVISAPTVESPITNGSGVITGAFSQSRAQDLATQLNAGALPIELKTQQVLTVSPTLGKESLDEGIAAGLVGLALLALYLLFYYRILAVVAWLGMTIWAVLALALVAVAGQTVGYSLTLAGVAGLVISLGVTADSYIVFFERFKDEVHAGKSPRVAVQPAFKRSFRTIVAADIVTALAAVVLYLTAISSVRGFALTLGVSVLLDLFVVYFFKRPAVFLLARNERLVTMRGIGVTSGVAVEREPAPAIAGGSE